MEIFKEPALSYNDVLIIPQYSDIPSRDEIDITTDFLGLKIKPIISAPMDYVTNVPVIKILTDNQYYGILHRFREHDYELYRDAVELIFQGYANFGAAVGLNTPVNNLTHPAVHSLCIDVAHGNHKLVIDRIAEIKRWYPTIKVIAGNVVTTDGFYRLADAGADAIRVGIGPGSACTTRVRTGIGYPQLSAVAECATVRDKYPKLSLIADGGIESSGDIVKALAAGADVVMTGKLLAGHHESPGEQIFYEGRAYKPYRGQGLLGSNGRRNAPEGVEGYVEAKGNLVDTLSQLENWIKSGLSYVGARNLTELRENAMFVKVSPGTQLESSTRLMEIR